jgi:glycosyltransferase involved in cell wall biosynthesis
MTDPNERRNPQQNKQPNCVAPYYEAIFVDNCQKDGSLEIVEKEFVYLPYLKILK